MNMFFSHGEGLAWAYSNRYPSPACQTCPPKSLLLTRSELGVKNTEASSSVPVQEGVQAEEGTSPHTSPHELAHTRRLYILELSKLIDGWFDHLK